MAWTTLAKVKEYLQITDTASDTLLTDLLARLQAWAESYLDRKIESAAYTEQQDGDGTSLLTLKQYPVTAVTSIHDDTLRVFGADRLIAAADYVTYGDRGQVKLDGLVFTIGLQNVKAIYTAGYATVPPELVQALCELVADRFRNKENQGVKSLTIGAYSVAYTDEEIPTEIKAVLDVYRRTRLA